MATNPTNRSKLAPLARWALFWMLFNGIGALSGVAMMWTAPDLFGMTPLLPLMHDNLPLIGQYFTSFVLPGLCLLLIIGVPHLIGAIMVGRHQALAPAAVIACGIILIGWTTLQLLLVFGPNPTSVVWCVFGVAETVMGAIWAARLRRPTAID